MARLFPCQPYTRGFDVNSRKEAGGIDNVGKIPLLCFFSYWTVTSDDCFLVLIQMSNSNNFIRPSNGHIYDK